MKLPDEILGRKIEGAYQEYLKRTKTKKPRVKQDKLVKPINIQNPESYIILEGRTHGSYSYPDLLVCMEKTHHNKDWYKTHEALHKEDSLMLTIRQFVDFINLLKTGKGFNGKGNKVDKATLDKILDKILTVRSPWRAEWLDADFKVVNDELYINYNHRAVNGELKPQNSELLEECLMKDKTPGISLGYWLKNATKQGLPPKDIPNGKLYYWFPRKDNNSVARFGADSGGAYLDCGRFPRSSGSALGVRAAKIKG